MKCAGGIFGDLCELYKSEGRASMLKKIIQPYLGLVENIVNLMNQHTDPIGKETVTYVTKGISAIMSSN